MEGSRCRGGGADCIISLEHSNVFCIGCTNVFGAERIDVDIIKLCAPFIAQQLEPHEFK